MTLGISATHANAVINILRNVTYTGLAGLFVKLHTSAGDPGPAGTSNASALATRSALVLNAPSPDGFSSMASLGSFTMTASETIRYVSLWDTAGPAGGLFVGSGQLSADKIVVASDVITFDTFVVSQGPIAA